MLKEIIQLTGYRKGEEPDFSEALIVRNKSSIEEVCDQVHRTLKETFKYAMVWGASARHVPQRVGLSHIVADEDVVSIGTQILELILLVLYEILSGKTSFWSKPLLLPLRPVSLTHVSSLDQGY